MTPQPGLLPGRLMAAEIAEQPAALARLLEAEAAIAAIADQVRVAAPKFVLLAARGTSDNAALYAKYLVETVLGLPAGLVSPSTFTGYAATPDLRDVLWIAISQSGGSPDLVESTRAARSLGALTLAVTNAPGSPLAEAAELHLDVLAGPEVSVAATKTYSSELLALWMFVQLLNGGSAAAARTVPEQVERVLGLPQIDGLVDRLVDAQHLITTGRGFSYPTARESALKLMETSYLFAQPFSGADLLHGPFAVIRPGTPVLAVVSPGVGGRLIQPVLERLRAAEADLIVVGPGSDSGSADLPLPDDLNEQLSPIVQIAPLQELALRLSVRRGNDPDRPRGLLKVTETR